MAWLASALLFTSWEGEQEEVPGSLALQLGPWPAGLLGNQESQAQLIKLWAMAVQESRAPRPCGSLVPQSFPSTEPVLRAGPSAGPLSLEALFPPTSEVQHLSSPPLPPLPLLAPRPWHTPADLTPAPNTAVKCGGIMESGVLGKGARSSGSAG